LLENKKNIHYVYSVDQKNNIMINRRIKDLRKALNMTQVSFSQVVSLSSGYLAGIETEKRKVNDRLIKAGLFFFQCERNLAAER